MCGCRRLLALGLIAFLLAGAAGAAERMYAVQVPVADRSSPARAEALRQAMQQLLVRVTGERDAARLVGIEPLLAQPEQYVQQFRYLDAAPAADAALELNVHFDGTAVERVLRANGLPVWGRERPPLLLWLAVGGDQRRLIGADSDHPLYAAAMGVARERGLTLLFPLLDLEDQARVGYADVWGGFEETVLAASQRYRSQLVLQGRLQAGAGGWRGRWTLHMGRDRLDWDSVGDTAAAALAQDCIWPPTAWPCAWPCGHWARPSRSNASASAAWPRSRIMPAPWTTWPNSRRCAMWRCWRWMAMRSICCWPWTVTARRWNGCWISAGY